MEQEQTQKQTPELSLSAPAAILIAGIIIAGAIIYIGADTQNFAENGEEKTEQPGITLEPVSGQDHIRGNLNAQVIIVEFSDLECPFCKSFHATMKKVMEEYGKNNEAAWVYRHFPLDIHTKARREAEATECAAELGGNIGFWNYADAVFKVTPSNNGLDLRLLPQIAEEIGLDRKAFEECLASERYADFVKQSIDDALNAGARGTPHSIVLTKDGKTAQISGAESFQAVREIIESALKKE